MFIETGFRLSLYDYKENRYLFLSIVKKMFIEVKLCNLTTCVFKGHVQFVKIYMVKFDVSILNKLKIMGFFCKYKANA